ncbi:MAG: DUF4406 domain-containing protein [Cyclobacteriaceae bacterium]|nr:DUF4406 domain-containing protein [Cyclobacteriaceae bacterium]
MRTRNWNCYIAGKITGLPVEEVTAKFKAAEAKVISLGLTPICPLDLSHNHGKSWEEYMREDITALLNCEYMYALKDWRQSTGATIEVELALKLGITIYHER